MLPFAMGESGFSRAALIRSSVLSLLWLFAVPLLSALFFSHADSRYDAPYLEHLAKAERQGRVTARTAAFYRQNPPSKLCRLNPSAARMRLRLPCSTYDQFYWARRVAWGCILSGLAAMLLMGLLLAISLRSQSAQLHSFRFGWWTLKLLGALQIAAQGLLVVALSYWVTALWMKVYVPKLILAAALLALIGVGLVIKGIFTRTPRVPAPIEGRLVDETAAPALWQRIRDLCARVHTAPPDHLVVGIDANFFVTEHALTLDKKLLEGRTLYVSLPLLAVLAREEADAVLAHEMAHFSGDDTLYSRKLSPLLDRYVRYLQALHGGVVTLPVFQFMLAYWTLFQLSLSRTARQRELRADRLASEQTSANAVARALLKIAAYCSFRDKVEGEILKDDAFAPELAVAHKIASGFTSYAKSPELDELFDQDPHDFGHPFDTHPPLSTRVRAVEASIGRDQYRDVVLEAPEDTWRDSIEDASSIEDALWQAHEERLGAAQQMMLAYRLLPANDEERALVAKSFPELTFAGEPGGPTLVLDCERLRSDDGGTDLRLADITKAQLVERTFREYLQLELDGGAEHTICISRLEGKGKPFLADFGRYYERALVAKQHIQTAEV
ncbi:MAG: M48 family metallopeptidase [Myxococcales bacterium]|nr:M48 family metallopeptidase [Myxococcales bacterium]